MEPSPRWKAVPSPRLAKLAKWAKWADAKAGGRCPKPGASTEKDRIGAPLGVLIPDVFFERLHFNKAAEDISLPCSSAARLSGAPGPESRMNAVTRPSLALPGDSAPYRAHTSDPG
jgi:hypothetical protein